MLEARQCRNAVVVVGSCFVYGGFLGAFEWMGIDFRNIITYDQHWDYRCFLVLER